jgi:cbb3-type cytochrome oxidase subunit 1
MDWLVRAFIKASVTWLALGVMVGVAMGIHPTWTVYRTAHMHIMLLGFVAMMIFGVAYHVIPRFAGHPLHDRRAALAHWWLANTGLTAMVIGFVGRANAASGATAAISAGGVLSGIGAYVFAYLVWQTIDGPRSRQLDDRAVVQSTQPVAIGLRARRKAAR